jgi:hypothetical protein
MEENGGNYENDRTQSQKAEIRGQKSEVRDRKSEDNKFRVQTSVCPIFGGCKLKLEL